MDSLRVRLMLLAALALLPLAGLVFHNAEMQWREAAVDAKNDALRLVRICADNEEQIVDSADRLLALMAEMPVVKKLDAQACGPLFARALGNETGYANLGLLNREGEVVASARPVAMRKGAGEEAFFQEAVRKGKFTVSDFELEQGGREAEMMCGEVVKAEDGSVEGVMFAELDLGWISGLPSRLGLPPEVTMGVLNRDGIILMRVPNPEQWVGKSALEADAGRTIMERRGSGTADEEGVDHARRLFAFTPLDPAHGLADFVSAGIPDEIAFSAARHSEHRQLLMLAVFAIAAFAAAWFAADILVLRGLRALLRATHQVAEGDLRTRAGPVHGGGEFRELAQAFNTMAASLEQQGKARDAAEQELERRVEQRTRELAEANSRLQQEVAERRRVEAELRVSKERLDLALKGSNDGIWDWDLVTNQVYFSPRWKEMLGHADEEIGEGAGEWETRLHPEDRDRALATVREYLSGKRPAFELEHRLRHKDGSYRWILSRGLAVRDEAGKPVRMAGSHADVTERRQAKEELERTTAELRRSNQELEQFAYIASHDLQEPLRMVMSYTQLLERRYGAQLDDTAREFMGYAVDGAKRMQQFIAGLLRFSRLGTDPKVFEEVSLEEVYNEALANLRIMIEETGAKVEARGLPVVQGDPRQLTQLFQNLIGNAVKFRKPGQPPRVEVLAEREGDCWRVSVRDNGIGMDPRFSDRVFVLFQRLHTREEYEGTGLGLAICKKIVERHGGRIWVESKEGEGAVFFFTLPALPSLTHETVQS